MVHVLCFFTALLASVVAVSAGRTRVIPGVAPVARPSSFVRPAQTPTSSSRTAWHSPTAHAGPSAPLAGVAHVDGAHQRTSGSGPLLAPKTTGGRVARRAEESGGPVGDRVQLKVLSPEGVGMTASVSEVILPSASGQLGVLANHAPMMSALDIGVLRYKQDGEWKPLVTYGGFASVDSNTMSVLVNDFETADGIDSEETRKELDAATAALEKAESKKDKLDATQQVKKASARLQAAMFGKKK